jgi:hypothetical protein
MPHTGNVHSPCRHGVAQQIAQHETQRRRRHRKTLREPADDLSIDRPDIAERSTQAFGRRGGLLGRVVASHSLEHRVDELERGGRSACCIVRKQCGLQRRLQFVCDKRGEVLQRFNAAREQRCMPRQTLLGPAASQQGNQPGQRLRDRRLRAGGDDDERACGANRDRRAPAAAAALGGLQRERTTVLRRRPPLRAGDRPCAAERGGDTSDTVGDLRRRRERDCPMRRCRQRTAALRGDRDSVFQLGDSRGGPCRRDRVVVL